MGYVAVFVLATQTYTYHIPVAVASKTHKTHTPKL